MRRIKVVLHTTLDGFVGGPNGEMDWIQLDDEMFDLVGNFTDESDTALYGRVTWEMMDSYWPTAAEKPNASKHDIEHSQWYNKVNKVVLSKTMQGIQAGKTTFIAGNIAGKIQDLKQPTGKDILIFGSPTAVHALMEHNLIDDYWLFVNPIILGNGIPLFANIKDRIKLNHVTTKVFSCSVAGLHYTVEM